MNILKDILPARFFEVLEKAGICTPKQIIVLSHWDIKKATNLLYDDILLLKSIVSNYYSPICVTCDKFQKKTCRIKTGCSAIDNLLRGGFRKGTITEIYGESGTGKTQIALQVAAYCGDKGSVIISTEDIFPVKRFNQINKAIINRSENADSGKSTFIEHLTDSHELLSCVRVRLPILLSKNRISSVIIDSVAAPFRSEHTNYVQRAEELREFAVTLLNLAQEYNMAVICINQVTASFDGSDDVLPTLGLVWSNMMSYRFKLRKISETIQNKDSSHHINLRELTVIHAPDLPSGISAKLLITASGVENVIYH
ncbi:unnamed protein product, partial [Brenthis ino]